MTLLAAADARKNWTEEECIEEMQRLRSEFPNKNLTRNFFRIHSIMPDHAWERHFGSYKEFRRKAGLEVNRSQNLLKNHIAKHASTDHYRALNEERGAWGRAYVRDNNKRFKTLLVASDLHDKEIDPFFLEVFIDTAKRAQPEIIVFGGDIFDLAEFGRFGVDPRDWDVTGRIKFVHEKIFTPIREVCPDTQLDFIEGNHEFRLVKHMADQTPALRAVLDELHGFNVARLLGLDQFQINYIAKGDLGAWTKRDINKELAKSYQVYWDCFLVHHFPHAREMGLPGVNGHHHQHALWALYSPIFGAYEWTQLGCGHQRSASYCEGEKWHNGFALVHIDTEKKRVNQEYVPITDHAVVGGQWYYRDTK